MFLSSLMLLVHYCVHNSFSWLLCVCVNDFPKKWSFFPVGGLRQGLERPTCSYAKGRTVDAARRNSLYKASVVVEGYTYNNTLILTAGTASSTRRLEGEIEQSPL